MSRALWWCSVCGRPTSRRPDDGPYARCLAHSNLPTTADLLPPLPNEIMPTMAAQLSEDTQATREKGH